MAGGAIPGDRRLQREDVMHPLHEYISRQLAQKLKARRVVVWYDPKCEFEPFITELRAAAVARDAPLGTPIGDGTARLVDYAGSLFEVRLNVESAVSMDLPEPMVIYVAGCERDRRGSVLMELEKAGECYEPQLKRLARDVLRQRYTDGVIDEMLRPERVTYQDLAKAASDTRSTEPPSILKAIFHDASGSDALLLTWLADTKRDAEIDTKEATRELLKLVRSRLGLDLPADAALGKLRTVTLRYVLANEFRADLKCPAPESLGSIPSPESDTEKKAVRDLARGFRLTHAGEYEPMADRLEGELGLPNAKLSAEDLGSIDTFRFEERSLLRHCGELIAAERFDEALSLVIERENSFWVNRDVNRKAHWEACRRMAELGKTAAEVRVSLAKVGSDPRAWVDRYAQPGGWHRLDLAQRRLESWVVNLEDDAEERPLGVARRAYEDVCRQMTQGFTKSLREAGWTVADRLHQTRVFSEMVSPGPKPVAYFLVDAMRYEMGTELASRLPKAAEVAIRPAIGSLPSITPIGMAALMPGASGSFSVVEQGGKLGARIEDVFLPDVVARKKFAGARVPKLVDVTLDELLSLQPSKLKKKLDGAQVVVVRSQEIDHAGEAGFTFQARQIMDTVIDNLARAVRKLSAAGVERSVVSADHGHLFFPVGRDESMRIESPGGPDATVELHRRCWIGRGGSTPPGCVRVTASELGYDSNLEFVFPAGGGVFKAGGDLAFHHGGPSLQEMVIPVVTVLFKSVESTQSAAVPLTVSGTPAVITNRIFSVTLELGGQNLTLFSTTMAVRAMLVSEGKQVGTVGMAVGAELDRSTGNVTLSAGKPATVAFLLGEDAPSIRVVVQDPSNDAELYRSQGEIPVRFGV
jgi:hypothetical protein